MCVGCQKGGPQVTCHTSRSVGTSHLNVLLEDISHKPPTPLQQREGVREERSRLDTSLLQGSCPLGLQARHQSLMPAAKG